MAGCKVRETKFRFRDFRNKSRDFRNKSRDFRNKSRDFRNRSRDFKNTETRTRFRFRGFRTKEFYTIIRSKDVFREQEFRQGNRILFNTVFNTKFIMEGYYVLFPVDGWIVLV